MFSTADARSFVTAAARCGWSRMAWLLTEVHTFDEVKRQGMAEASWQRCPDGICFDVPHPLLTNVAGMRKHRPAQRSSGAIEPNGHTTRFGSQMTAWRDDEYVSLLDNAGFNLLPPPESHDWPVSKTFEGKLFVLLAEKAKASEELP